MPLGLIALALGGFGIGLTEFVIAGLLPEVAGTFQVSESTAGWLISGYALSVAFGAIVITAAVTKLDRKHVLAALMVLFIAGNLLSALSGNFEMMMLGRVIAALAHGAFFGIGSVVAASLVPANKKAAAVAIMFAGLTTANVLGVPLGTFVGQQFGWRSTFWILAVLGVASMIGIALLVPNIQNSKNVDDSEGGLLSELGAFRNPHVWLSLAVTVLGFGGMFGTFTYIAYTLTAVSGFSAATVPWLLVLFGAGLFLGNLLGGRAADRSVNKTIVIALLVLAADLTLFALFATSQVITVLALFGMGLSGFAIVPALQIRIMNYARQAPTLASAANIASFNVGNAIGAWLGGMTIAAGFGYTGPIWCGVGLTVAAIAVLLTQITTERGTSTVKLTAPVAR